MSKGPITAVYERDASESRNAGSAVLLDQPRLGQGILVAEGAVLRSDGPGVVIETGSAVSENSVVVGAAQMPTSIGRRTTFGHRCLVIGATVGDLCARSATRRSSCPAPRSATGCSWARARSFRAA